MAYRKRKHSAASSQDYRALHEVQSFNDEDGQCAWEVCDRIRSAQSTLEGTQKATEAELPDSSVRTNILNERVMMSGNHVERMAMEPAMNEEVKELLW